MSVYYKFNSELNYSYVDFDGLHIAVSDLKKAILHQKRLGKTADFDLLISNAQTKEEYKDEQCLIPKNTSLIVARIPLSNQNKKSWEIAAQAAQAERTTQNPTTENINHDITRMNGTEDDKIQAMMMQSTLDYDPTNYQRVRGTTQMGDVPANYRCHKCHKPGHWIKNCPLNPLGKDNHHFKTRPESKKMTGIPRSLRDAITENQEPVQSQFIEEKREIPEDLICAICKGIFKDAVMSPCCGSSFCDECVRTALLESEDNECPDCKEKGTSPGSLIPNRFLRNAVAAFHAESSNVLNRDSQKKIVEEIIAPEEVEEEPIVEDTPFDEEVPEEETPVFENEDETPEIENEKSNKHSHVDKDSESDDDDNITVTVPPAHQQSRGASFRDSRLRRIPSHSVGEFSDSYAHSSSSKNQPEEGESYEEESGDSYAHRHHSSSKRGNHYDSSQPQGIATLGEDKGSNRDHYREHSSRPPPNISSHDESYQPHQQHPPQYNQAQHPGMMNQMQPHAMYPQGPYHQPSGQYYQQNQIRRYDHQGNYQMPIRHNAPTQMMRPSMHDNYGMRHQRPPINNLANAVTQNIQQRYGTGFIDDPLEAFNRIMREKELRKEQRYRRSPAHIKERRSRSFERKRSPMHQYSPDNRRQKNYPKTRKRSRSFKSNSKSYSRSRSRERSTRGRSKSRSYSPRYRRKENVQVKDRRDDRHRSPARRGNYQNNRSSRGNYKGDSTSSKPSFRDGQENLHYHHENTGNQHEKLIEDFPKDSNAFEPSHSLDEQPPPPGDESEAILPPPNQRKENVQEKETGSDEAQTESTELNGKVESESRKDERHHHHHKKNRSTKNYESSDDKKIRDKKKRKKSRENEKKKSKKDRKSRSDKEKDKKDSSKAGSPEKTPEAAETTENFEKIETAVDEKSFNREEEIDKSLEVDDRHHTPEIEEERIKPLKAIGEKQSFRRSDSILDINPNVDLDLDEWAAPEVSKWERDDANKSLLDTSEDVGNGDVRKNPEERVTIEIIKRAENAIFARAISAIRPVENKKSKPEIDTSVSKIESLSTTVLKRSDSSNQKDSKINAYQVTVNASDSGTRSIELKPSESTRDTSKQRKSPLRTSIKNRLGVKVVDKKSRSRTPSRSPKRRLQSDCTKVSQVSRDRGGRSQAGSIRDRHASPDRRNKQMSSCIRVEPRESGRVESRETGRTEPRESGRAEPRDSGRGNRNTERRRSRTPDDRRTVKRPGTSRSRSKSRHEVNRRHDQRSNNEKSYTKPKEPSRNDEKSSRAIDQSSLLSDLEKSKTKNVEAPIRKRSRDPSSSSSSSTNSSSGSQKHSKRHNKTKTKRRSRSLSAESTKRKKSKKEKKAKKKKKSRK